MDTRTHEQKIEDALDTLHGPRETFREVLEPTAILERMCRTAILRAEQENMPAWSIIGQITGHGSGVSSAILNVYRPHDQ